MAAQTYKDFELLVVDDGSPDDTQVVAQRFIEAHGLAGGCVRQPNGKIAAARNNALARARGELLAFLDHDDLWTPDKLAVCVAEFDKDPSVGLVHHPCRIVDSEGKPMGLTHNGPWVPDMYQKLLLGANCMCPSSVVVRAAHVTAAGGFRADPRFDTCEDYDLWMRLAKVCRFKFIDPPLGDYLMAAGGASKRVRYHHDNQEALLLDHFAALSEPDAETRLLMRRRLGRVYRAAARAMMNNGDWADAREYAGKLLRSYPWDPRNLVILGLAALSATPLRVILPPLLRLMPY